MRIAGCIAGAALLFHPEPASAEQLRAAIYLIDASGPAGPAGEVLIADGEAGARFLVELHDLRAGEYRLRIHMEGDCAPGPDNRGAMAPGVAAGEPWKPSDGAARTGMVVDLPPADQTAADVAPELPSLQVAADGRVALDFVEPSIADATQLWHRSLVVHDGAGRRIACGVID